MTAIFAGTVVYATDKMVMVEDAAGNIFIWHTTGASKWEGKKVHLEGEIKSIKVLHGDYKLTIVSKCKPFKGM